MDNAIKQEAENERKKVELEDKILNQIATSKVDILEDDILYEALDESKNHVEIMNAERQSNQGLMKSIKEQRENFDPVALRVARLFFVLLQVMNIDPMYQYSLDFFKTIYDRALSPKVEVKKKEKKDFFIKEFTRLLYENICRSLFEKDKLLFSFLIHLKIVDEEPGALDPNEVRILLTGGTSVEMEKPNPTGDGGWLSDKIWASILQLTREFKAF